MLDSGGPEHWFEQQLRPSGIPDPAGDAVDGWWDSLHFDHRTLWKREIDGVEPLWYVMQCYASWCLMRRTYSRRQVHEAMTEFWENHLHIPIYDDGVSMYRAAYGRLLRRHALGRFDEMLVAAITHPAMSISLDNAISTKSAPNENLGRELLELHTVGKGNHSEDDVKNAAKILTGYRVAVWNTWDAAYDTRSHWTGAVKVLGFSHTNTNADGRAVTSAFLRYLAHHPKTAERIARKLAVRFVSDTPSDELVAKLAEVYLSSDTAIVPVIRALIASDEFKNSVGMKVRTPTDDVVAMHRTLQTSVAKPTAADSAANTIVWQSSSIGQVPFGWARPDGQPDNASDWSGTSRILNGFDVHYTSSGQWWPVKDITYKPHASWLPSEAVRFDFFVDHLSRTLFGQAADDRLQLACSQVTKIAADEVITASHALIQWQFPLLMTTLLDGPDHLLR